MCLCLFFLMGVLKKICLTFCSYMHTAYMPPFLASLLHNKCAINPKAITGHAYSFNVKINVRLLNIPKSTHIKSFSYQ